jgi:hypothetical protein
MANPSPPTDDLIRTLFVDLPPVEPNTFELALVLGGTVSAGAYTAGVLDFLFEALDEWTSRRDRKDDVPQHRVQIRLISGTSGGGVNAAIAARALAYPLDPVSRGTPVGSNAPTGNPFYDVWCRMLNLAGFLETGDLRNARIQSVLNGAPIDQAAEHIAGYQNGPFMLRSYVGEPERNEPMRVILTMTNLFGIPYRTVFSGNPPTVGETFVDHADHIRFAVLYPDQSRFEPRPDETVLTFDATPMPRASSWDEFSMCARATAAFPMGFPARTLNRNNYRIAVIPSEGPGNIYKVLTPDWDQLTVGGVLPGNYSFVAVDGGATDNEPISLARTALCGITARNPRDAKQANRAVLLIDPFSGEAGLGTPPGGIFSVATGTLNALLQQTRYDTADLVLAADPTVFSRFLISANRDGQIGSKAIASGGLGAFIGFACPAFTRHDYLLGRANCQAFLQQSFGVDPTNPVVSTTWTDQQKTDLAFVAGEQALVPLIPLYGNAAETEMTDPWPVGALDPNAYHDAIAARWKALLEAGLSETWWEKLVAWLTAEITEDSIATYAATQFAAELAAWKLLPTQSRAGA